MKVKIRVKVGSLGYNDNMYAAGDVIEVDENDLKGFDPHDYELVKPEKKKETTKEETGKPEGKTEGKTEGTEKGREKETGKVIADARR